MGQVHVTNPRYVLVISGGCCSPQKKTFVVGSWAYICSCVTNVQKISLELMTLLPHCEDVETSLGVPLTVSATAQCKIIRDKELLKVACEQFLGYDLDEIEFAIRSTLEGHLRAILGTLTVEEVYRDRDKFASLVREVASPDVGRMGVEIISFTIRDITDKVGYLNSLGKTQTALVKRNASIGVAITNRDAGIKEAEAEKTSMNIKYLTDAEIGKNKNRYLIALAGFEREIRMSEAEVALAYELKSNILAQEIAEAEIEINIAEKKKLTEVEKNEVSRKQMELTGSIRLPAEAEARKMEILSKGWKLEKILMATAEAEKIKHVGMAKAFHARVVGEAEAFAMFLKAESFKKYKEAAKLAIIFNYLPEIASNISRPLSKIEEMLLLGQTDDLIDNANKIFGKIPVSLRTIGGIDVTNFLRKRLNITKKNDADNSYKEK